MLMKIVRSAVNKPSLPVDSVTYTVYFSINKGTGNNKIILLVGRTKLIRIKKLKLSS